MESRKDKILFYAIFFAIIFPLMYWWIYTCFVNPPPIYYNSDPQMQYWSDSLAPFTGNTYRYTDHPGTPVTIVGTLFFALTYLFTYHSSLGFIEWQYAHPNVFFYFSSTFLVILFSLAMYYQYKVTYIITKKFALLTAAIIALVYFAVTPKSIESTTFWSHNAFIYPLGATLFFFFYANLNTESLLHRKYFAHILGLLSGVLTTFQLGSA